MIPKWLMCEPYLTYGLPSVNERGFKSGNLHLCVPPIQINNQMVLEIYIKLPHPLIILTLLDAPFPGCLFFMEKAGPSDWLAWQLNFYKKTLQWKRGHAKQGQKAEYIYKERIWDFNPSRALQTWESLNLPRIVQEDTSQDLFAWDHQRWNDMEYQRHKHLAVVWMDLVISHVHLCHMNWHPCPPSSALHVLPCCDSGCLHTPLHGAASFSHFFEIISLTSSLSLSLQSNSLISVSPISQSTHHTYFVCIVALTIALLCSDRFQLLIHSPSRRIIIQKSLSLSFTAFSANKQALLILCRPPNPPHKLSVSFWTFSSPVSEKPCPLAHRILERLGLSPGYPSGNYHCWLAASLPHHCRYSDHRHSQVFFACWMRPISELPLCCLKKDVPKASIPDDDNFFFLRGRGEFSG